MAAPPFNPEYFATEFSRFTYGLKPNNEDMKTAETFYYVAVAGTEAKLGDVNWSNDELQENYYNLSRFVVRASDPDKFKELDEINEYAKNMGKPLGRNKLEADIQDLYDELLRTPFGNTISISMPTYEK